MIGSLALAVLCLSSSLQGTNAEECGTSGLRTLLDTEDVCSECRLNGGAPFVVASAPHCEAKCANAPDGVCQSALYSVHTKQCWLNGVSLETMGAHQVRSNKNFIAFSRCSPTSGTVVPEAPADCLAPRFFLADSTGDLCKECTLPNGARRGVGSLAACQDLCAADERCMSATFWAAYGKCWLKDRRLDQMDLAGLVPTDEYSPISRCPSNILPPPELDCLAPTSQTVEGFLDMCEQCTLPGGTRLRVQSLAECQELCAAEDDCLAATYWADQRKCYLKDRTLSAMLPSQIAQSDGSFSATTRCPEERAVLPPQPLSCRAPFFHLIPGFRDYCAACTLPHGVVPNVPDHVVCEAKCDNVAGCLSAVYEQSDQVCYLKDRRLQDMKPNEIGAAGDTWIAINMCRESVLPLPPKGCHWPSFQVIPGIQDSCPECVLPDGIISSVEDAEECQELCSLTTGCQAAGFSGNTHRCYLKDRRFDEMEFGQVTAADKAFTAIQRCPCAGCAYPDFESYIDFKSTSKGSGIEYDLPDIEACLDSCVERGNCESLSFQSLDASMAAMELDPEAQLRTVCRYSRQPVEEQYPRTEVRYTPGWQMLSRCQCDAPVREFHAPPLRCKRVRSSREQPVAAQPTYMAFKAVDVHTLSQPLTFRLAPSDPALRAVKARCVQINPSFKSDVTAFQLGASATPCAPRNGVFKLSVDLPGDLAVSFQPPAKGVYTAHVELLDSAEAVLVTLTVVGIGGEAFVGEHFSHPVMEADSVYIALPGEDTAQVLVQGRGSHTHERRSLMDYLWTNLITGSTTVEMDFQCRHELGVHGYQLTVTDNHRAFESDIISFEVAPAHKVPGTLMRFFKFLDKVPDGTAVWSSLQTSSFSASAGHFGDTEANVIAFTGTFLWPGGKQELTWSGCQKDTIQVFVDKAPLQAEGSVVKVTGPAEERELTFSCRQESNSLLEVLLNGAAVPKPHLSVLDLRPTLNKLVSSNLTRPGDVGTVSGFYLGDAIITLAKGKVVLEPKIQGRTERGIRFDYPPGEVIADGEWSIYAVRGRLESNRITVTIKANAPLAPTFRQHKLTPTVPQSAATVYCHGKLYVANVWDGFIYEYTLNDDNEVTDWQTDVKLITSIPHLIEPGTASGESPGLEATILGMACDPWETDDDYKIYFTRNQLFRNEVDAIEHDVNGQNWTEWRIPEKVWYTSKISYAEPHKSNCYGVTNFFYDENPSVCTLAPIHDLLTGLSCSNYDHAQNCMAFTHERRLLLCSGSSSNAGIPNPSLKSLTEAPLSGAILEIDLFAPGFREPGKPHAIEYEWLENVPSSIKAKQSPDDMRFGMHARLKPSSSKYVWPRVSGCRNPFGLTVTMEGYVHATVSGPNSGFGMKLNGTTEDGEPLGSDDDFGGRLDPVVLNVPPEGCHMGHANIARCNAGRAAGLAQEDILDCTWRSWLSNHEGYCAHEGASSHVFELESALGGILAYKSQVFGGTVRDSLYIPSYRGWTWRCPAHVTHGTDCVPDAGQGADDLRDRKYPASPGLAIQHIPGGAHVITEYFRDSVFINSPDYMAAGPETWAVHPDRAPSTTDGRVRFVISGARLHELLDVVVYFGEERVAEDTLVINPEGTRIRGFLPNSPTAGLVDVRVNHQGGDEIMPAFFFYLPDSLSTAS